VFEWAGNVQYGEIDGFRVYWQRPGDVGWTQVADLFCDYHFLEDGTQVWTCPTLQTLDGQQPNIGFPIQRYLHTLPGTEYKVCLTAWKYDHSSGEDLESSCTVGVDVEVGTDTFCMPEYWLCDENGCSEVRA
jgi:hypothetical protein